MSVKDNIVLKKRGNAFNLIKYGFRLTNSIITKKAVGNDVHAVHHVATKR